MKKIYLLMLLIVSLMAIDMNSSMEQDFSMMDNNQSINPIQSPIEQNISIADLNLSTPQEENITTAPVVSDVHKIKIAIVLDKNKFFKYIPSLLNSINGYMIKKDINYELKLIGVNNDLNTTLANITPNYKFIFTYITNPQNIKILNKYPNNYFFIPTISKDQLTYPVNNNIFFGGIDYKKQIILLNQYVSSKTYIISDNSEISDILTNIVDNTLLFPHELEKYPIRYEDKYNDAFVYLNTKVVHTAQILSNFTYHRIKTKALLSTQINWTPLIFSLTNPEDVENLYIANSILNINPVIESNDLNLGSNIKYNWLDWTTSVLLNKAINIKVGDNPYFLNDFNLYMFYNQVQYKIYLYRIFQNGFVKIIN